MSLWLVALKGPHDVVEVEEGVGCLHLLEWLQAAPGIGLTRLSDLGLGSPGHLSVFLPLLCNAPQRHTQRVDTRHNVHNTHTTPHTLHEVSTMGEGGEDGGYALVDQQPQGGQPSVGGRV